MYLRNALLLFFVLCGSLQAQAQLYKNSKLPVAVRVKDLLSKMTVEEKAGQLNQLSGGEFMGPAGNDEGQKEKLRLVSVGAIGSFLNVTGVEETTLIQKLAVEKSRLGIPVLFGFDVIHGYRTIFPIPLAQACSWDLKTMKESAAISAKEGAAAGVHWTFAPMCDVSNDARWGRVMEGMGEDPWYASLIAVAKVKGTQGNFSLQNLLACVKHYAGYGMVESGKEYNFTDFSRVQLFNKVLPPFKAAIDAGAATVMNGFNTFEGVPVSASKYLVTDILKKKWGFKGFIASDWNSFGEIVDWGYAADKKDAVHKAFKAGSMMDMETRGIIKYMPELVKEGKISVQELDEAVGRILEAKFKLGLFENPYRYSDAQREKQNIFTPAHRKLALEQAQQSIVLLKNNKTLPINAAAQKIALIGDLAVNKAHIFDFWVAKGDSASAVSLKEAAEKKWAGNVKFSQGYNVDGETDQSLIDNALNISMQSDVIVINVGISGKKAGEDRALANPVVPKNQLDLIKALKAAGKPIVAVVTAGRPLVLTELEPMVDAIVYGWILGTETGNALVDVLDGTYNPSGKTVMTFPYAVGQMPIYYNHFNTGRPLPTDAFGAWYSRYLDTPNEPLYPFGYGLSYTKFEYADMRLSSAKISSNQKVKLSVLLKNNGDYDGYEVAQLYIRDMVASVVRPIKELKGFQRVFLKKGESKTLTFEIGRKELLFYNANGDEVLENGSFEVFVGGNSRDVLKAKFELL